MKRPSLLSLAALLPLLVVPATMYGAPGDPDATFGTAGLALTTMNGTSQAYRMALRPDGSILLAGGEAADLRVVRILPTGQKDASFAGAANGQLIINLNFGNYCAGLVALADNSFIVGARHTSGQDTNFAVLKYAAAGAIAAAYGTNGQTITSSGPGNTTDTPQCIVADGPGGGVLLAGNTRKVLPTFATVRYFGAVRYLASGALDTGYGAGGWATFHTGPDNADHDVNCMARQPDGKVLVAGSIVTEGSRKAAVVRFTAGGQPDPSFGAGGLILVQGVTSFTAAAVRPDGRILLAGENGASLFVIRLMPGGALDSAFGSDGSVRYNGTISPFTCQDIAIQPNGKILLATTSGSTGGPRAYAAVLRLTSVGALDTTFAGSGYVFANLSTTIDTSEAVAIQPDGKILSAGTSADRSYVFRLAGDAPWVSPLPAWRQTNFGTMNNSGLAANDADPDQDGVTNLMEYAFNLNPNSAASRSIPAFVTTASGISIAYTHPDPAGTKLLNIAVEATLDPASNSWAPRPDENPSASVFSASLSFANGPHAFLRLRVTEGSGP